MKHSQIRHEIGDWKLALEHESMKEKRAMRGTMNAPEVVSKKSAKKECHDVILGVEELKDAIPAGAKFFREGARECACGAGAAICVSQDVLVRVCWAA
jgi:hypothetical protein